MCERLLSLDRWSDEALLARVRECVTAERKATAALLACLGEFDRRRLYLAQGFSSLFTYCTQHLHLSERAAYGRIQAARLARRFPLVLELIENGSVSLTAVAMLATHLTEANHRAMLAEATHKSTREVEKMVARLDPQPVRPDSVRRMPASTPVVVASASPAMSSSVAGAPAAAVDAPPVLLFADVNGAAPAAPGRPTASSMPDVTAASATREGTAAPLIAGGFETSLAEERYTLRVTISKAAHAQLMRARELLRHSVPDGDLGLVLERAIAALAKHLDQRKLALVARPRERIGRTDTRHIPAAVRREVWKRDGGRCAFVGALGRCRERGLVELHHVRPFAAGGQATAANIELRCRAHNAYEAQIYFAAERGP